MLASIDVLLQYYSRGTLKCWFSAFFKRTIDPLQGECMSWKIIWLKLGEILLPNGKQKARIRELLSAEILEWYL